MEGTKSIEKSKRFDELADSIAQQVLNYFKKRKEEKEEATILPRPLPLAMEIVVRPWGKSLRIKTEIPFRNFFINEEGGRGLVYQEVKKLLYGAEKTFGKTKLIVEIQTKKGERILNIMHDCSAQVAAVLAPEPQAKPKLKLITKPKQEPKQEPQPQPQPQPQQTKESTMSEPIDFKTMKFFPTDPSWRNIKKVFKHLGLETGNDVIHMLGTTNPGHREWDDFLNRLKQAANTIDIAFGPKCEDTLYVWLVKRKKWMDKLPPKAWGH